MIRHYKRLVSIMLSTLIFCFSCLETFASLDWDEEYFSHLYRHEDKKSTNLNDNIISYEEIEDYIFHKNPTMKNTWLLFDVNKDVLDTADTYYDAADALEGSSDDVVTDAMNAAKAHGLRISGDNATDDSRTNYMNNILQEKKIVLETKMAFINYHKSILETTKAEKMIEEARRQYESGQLNYQMNLLTKSELLKLENGLKEAESSYILAKSNTTNYKRTVLINCGYAMSENLELAPIYHVTTEQVDSHNDFQDKKVAIDNSIQYKIYKRKLENSRSEEAKTTQKINVEHAETYISNDIDKKYNDMHDGMVAIYTNALQYQVNKDSYDKAKNSYENGTISRKELNTAKYNEEVSKIDFEIKYFDLDILYETYISAIDGLAKAGEA